jgi:hypothetical protein
LKRKEETMAMTRFEKLAAKVADSEIRESLGVWAAENGYALHIPGRTTYTMEQGGLLRFKVEVRIDNGKSNGQVQWERRFMGHEAFPTECYAGDLRHIGQCRLLKNDDWEAEFEVPASRYYPAQRYRITGHNAAKTKYKVLAENLETGKTRGFTEHAAALWLGHEESTVEHEVHGFTVDALD